MPVTLYYMERAGFRWLYDSYDYLMGADLDHSHPEVRKDILDWGVWIVKELDAAGFRFDAVKHMCAFCLPSSMTTI